MMVKSSLDFFYFEIHRAPSEIPANLPGQFSPLADSQYVQSAWFVAGDFCQDWNLNSQISLDFDILIVISKANFKKKLNGQTRFT